MPISGDDIVSVQLKGFGIAIHRENCKKVQKLKRSHPGAVVKANWSNYKNKIFATKLKIVMLNQPGSLAQVASVIASHGLNLVNVAIKDNDIIKVTIMSNHNPVIIGKGGATLQALNEIVKTAVSTKFKRRFRVLLDVGDYKSKKYRKITFIAKKEAKRVLEKIRSNDHVILLDLHGSMDSSESFARKLDGLMASGSNIVFVIAGSLGPDISLIQRANQRWKLSDLTFTHLMTRVLILEQIYRGYMILNGRSYHK